MIDSVLLLSVGFGHRFEVDLLGLSTLVLPSPDAVKAGATPLAQVQLALRATFVPDEGYFALRAQLTENSYLLSRDCRLTGGFAFQVWFGEDHNGDFVLSVGGYHPRFTVPAHYPAVPRLGFTWQVTPQLTMKGSAYFALTPSALMAGGSFGATWQDGSLKAWFNASMDFLIGWSPYHYQADFWASIGASYTFSFFGTHTVSAQVGAQVSLWGPEFSGRAAIDIGICSFTLAFGAGDPAGPQPIDWTAFRKAFLPTADDAMVTVVLQGGAAGTGGAPAKGDLGSVNPLELVLSTDSVIPSHDAYRGPEQGGQALDTTGAATAFGIAPLGRGHNHPVAASQRIEIRRADGSRADDGFRYQPVTKNLPAAMWGDRLLPAVTDPALVDDLLTGYTIRPLPPAEPATAPYLPRDVLRAATALDTQQNAYRWLDRQPFVPDGRDAATRRQVIADSVTAPDTAAVRSAVAAAVLTGATGDDPLDLGGSTRTGSWSYLRWGWSSEHDTAGPDAVRRLPGALAGRRGLLDQGHPDHRRRPQGVHGDPDLLRRRGAVRAAAGAGRGRVPAGRQHRRPQPCAAAPGAQPLKPAVGARSAGGARPGRAAAVAGVAAVRRGRTARAAGHAPVGGDGHRRRVLSGTRRAPGR